MEKQKIIDLIEEEVHDGYYDTHQICLTRGGYVYHQVLFKNSIGFFVYDDYMGEIYVTHVLVKKPIEDVIKERMPTEEYWKKRCELAEKFILESPCDPDIHEDQIKAYNEWTDFKGDKLLKQD